MHVLGHDSPILLLLCMCTSIYIGLVNFTPSEVQANSLEWNTDEVVSLLNTVSLIFLPHNFVDRIKCLHFPDNDAMVMESILLVCTYYSHNS